MTRTSIVLIGAACLASIAGCKKEPHANFDPDKTSAEVGESVKFLNYSRDGFLWQWDFGDGTSSTEKEPTKVYDRAGKFTVRLTAYSKKKKKQDDDLENITVTEKPFEGTHNMESDFSRTNCLNSSTTYSSGTKNYQLVIRKGPNSDEIILDNLGGLGINNVRATVTKTNFFGVYQEADFTVTTGQTLIDSEGKIWTYTGGSISGNYDSELNCRSMSMHIQRDTQCGSSLITLTYSESSSSNGCN